STVEITFAYRTTDLACLHQPRISGRAAGLAATSSAAAAAAATGEEEQSQRVHVSRHGHGTGYHDPSLQKHACPREMRGHIMVGGRCAPEMDLLATRGLVPECWRGAHTATVTRLRRTAAIRFAGLRAVVLRFAPLRLPGERRRVVSPA